MLTVIASAMIGFCIGVLCEDSYDLMFRVEKFLRKHLP